MTNTTPISSDYYLSNRKPTVKQTGSDSLGKDAFLQLLVTQLQHQDPTAPMDNNEYIAQLAQFSSLEQMQNMTKAVEKLFESQQQSQLMNYTTFIGKKVEWHELTEEKDDQGKYIVNTGKGVIEQLKFVDGEPVFILEGGKEIFPGNISSVFSTTSKDQLEENPLVEASKLIGQTVQYKGANDELLSSIIDSVRTNSTIIEYLLKDGSILKRNQFELLTNE